MEEETWVSWSYSGYSGKSLMGIWGRHTRHTGTLMASEVWATSVDQGHLFRIGVWLVTRNRVSCAVTTFLMEMLTLSAETCRAEGLGLAGWHGTCCESV